MNINTSIFTLLEKRFNFVHLFGFYQNCNYILININIFHYGHVFHETALSSLTQ